MRIHQRILGYFGVEGSFAHEAARLRFPDRFQISVTHPSGAVCSFGSVQEAFARLVVPIAGGQIETEAETVSAPLIDPIVVPIENASSGTITDTIDQLIRLRLEARRPDLAVRECLAMRIRLFLLGAEQGVEPKIIYSHPAALTHSLTWLQEQYPHAKRIVTESTSVAALLAKREPGTAALAGAHTASLYGLQVLRDDVQEAVANRTKFYVIGTPLADSRPATHTSLLFELPHQPGSLVAALNALSRHGLNITHIESRPIPGRFDEYRFIVEFLGVPAPEQESSDGAALAELKRITHNLSVLGSYPILDIP